MPALIGKQYLQFRRLPSGKPLDLERPFKALVLF